MNKNAAGLLRSCRFLKLDLPVQAGLFGKRREINLSGSKENQKCARYNKSVK